MRLFKNHKLNELTVHYTKINKWLLAYHLSAFVKGTVRYRYVSIHVLFPFLNFGLLFIVLGLKGPLSEQWK